MGGSPIAWTSTLTCTGPSYPYVCSSTPLYACLLPLSVGTNGLAHDIRQAAQTVLRARADLVAREAALWQYGLMEGLWEGPHPCLHSLIDGAYELAGLLVLPIDAQEARQGTQLLRHLCSVAS